MSRFNFNNITLASKADITKVMENFTKIEENAATTADLTSGLSGKADTNHASTSTTYGVGTTASYGHCKVINDLTKAAFANGEALSAYQGKILNDTITNLDNSLGGLAKRSYSIGTTVPTGGSDGDIYDQYFD